MSSPPHGFDPPIVGGSVAAQRLRDLVLTLSNSDVSVLITGESGVGKEVLARNLHRFSRRRGKAFVSINCAALSPGTLESELFGHDRGAFTGAVRAHPGLFEQASGGTLLLDEIGEIPTRTQAKLLRVLQEGEVRRMGEQGVRRVDVRVLAATNASLADMVAKGTFRTDLYYRVNVVEAYIPPLRSRAEDILDLIAHFYRSRSLRPPEITDEARAVLTRYAWPGNVRELHNELQRVVALYESPRTLTPALFSSRLSESPREARIDEAILYEAPLATAVRHLEERLVRKALAQANWNKSQTARQLGLSRQGLLKKIKRYGISRDDSLAAAEESA